MPREPDDLQLQIRREVGARIRQHRTGAGLTLERLGEMIRRDRRTISLWEHGAAVPDLDDLTALAVALDLHLWQLFVG